MGETTVGQRLIKVDVGGGGHDPFYAERWIFVAN